MEAELAQMVTSGATTLVGLVIGDAYDRTKSRIAAFLGRGRPEETEAAAAELDASRRELVLAREDGDQGAVDDIEAAWRRRLRTVLRDDPQAARELRVLLDEIAPAKGPAVAVHNVVSGGTQYGPVIQGRDFSDLNFGASAPPQQ